MDEEKDSLLKDKFGESGQVIDDKINQVQENIVREFKEKIDYLLNNALNDNIKNSEKEIKIYIEEKLKELPSSIKKEIDYKSITKSIKLFEEKIDELKKLDYSVNTDVMTVELETFKNSISIFKNINNKLSSTLSGETLSSDIQSMADNLSELKNKFEIKKENNIIEHIDNNIDNSIKNNIDNSIKNNIDNSIKKIKLSVKFQFIVSITITIAITAILNLNFDTAVKFISNLFNDRNISTLHNGDKNTTTVIKNIQYIENIYTETKYPMYSYIDKNNKVGNDIIFKFEGKKVKPSKKNINTLIAMLKDLNSSSSYLFKIVGSASNEPIRSSETNSTDYNSNYELAVSRANYAKISIIENINKIKSTFIMHHQVNIAGLDEDNRKTTISIYETK